MIITKKCFDSLMELYTSSSLSSLRLDPNLMLVLNEKDTFEFVPVDGAIDPRIPLCHLMVEVGLTANSATENSFIATLILIDHGSFTTGRPHPVFTMLIENTQKYQLMDLFTVMTAQNGTKELSFVRIPMHPDKDILAEVLSLLLVELNQARKILEGFGVKLSTIISHANPQTDSRIQT